VRQTAKKLVQVNLKFRNPPGSVAKHWLEGAPHFGPKGNVKGLLWKIWLMNGAKKTAGGIYLFKDAASAKAYIHGPIVKAAPKCPGCSVYDIEVREWDILLKPTKITRGPVS
jgi:hypothetical protein